MKKVLIMMECSGVTRSRFRDAGFDAWSVDIKPQEDDGEGHVVGDAFAFAEDNGPWDFVLAHPPCTYLCLSGARWLYNDGGPNHGDVDPERWGLMEDGALDFKKCLEIDCKMIAVENPVMHKHAVAIVGRKPDQYIQPYNFGNDASKKTGLWLKGLPPLVGTKIVQPRLFMGRPRYGNQTNAGNNKVAPGPNRGTIRSRTYSGIADAIVNQWGKLI